MPNLAIISLLSSAVMLPILLYGVPSGYDMPHHYQLALTFRDSILAGDLYPSWTDLRNLGYGSLELRLYPPVSHYVLALFSLAVNDWHVATWLTYTFWWVLGSLGVYLWARELVSPRYAVVAALIYAVMPYRLNQAYLVFFYGELAGSAILPFCFAFFTRCIQQHRTFERANTPFQRTIISLNTVGFAVAYSLLILTHLPLTLIVSLALVIYAIGNLKADLGYCVRLYSRMVAAGAFALLATSFFWLKVIQERYLLAKTSVYEDVHLHYYLNFLLTPLQSYDLNSIHAYEAFTLVYDVTLAVTIASILPIALLAFAYSQKSHLPVLRATWITFIAAIFLTTILSKFLWDNISLIQEVQFPWRWLAIVSVLAPILAATGLRGIQNWILFNKRQYALVLIGILLIGASFSISNAVRGAIYKTPAEIDEYISVIDRSEGFQFWWPIWARKKVFDTNEKVLSGNRESSIQSWGGTEKTFTIGPGQKGDARLAVFYHPGWQAKVDGEVVQARPDANGALLIPVKEPAASVEITFVESPWIHITQYASLTSWFLVFGWVAVRLTRTATVPRRSQEAVAFHKQRAVRVGMAR